MDQYLLSVEVWAINSKIARRYELIMIYKCFYKRGARAENYDHSHCYASSDPKNKIRNIRLYLTRDVVIAVLTSYLLMPYGIGAIYPKVIVPGSRS